MRARFLAVVTGCLLTFALASGFWFAAMGRGRDVSVAFIGLQAVGLVVFLRAVLLASVPHGADPARADDERRPRHRWTAAGLALSALITAVGFTLVLDPLVAAVACVVAVGGLVVLVRALDGYARRTAATDPVDAVRAGDESRLEPEAIRATLLRLLVRGLVAGALAAAVIGPLVGTFGPGAVGGLVAGVLTLVAVSAVVLGFGSFGLSWAAGRRLSALMSEDPARTKRLRRAVLRRRTAGLDEDDRRDAQTWAREAEPAFLLQLLSQLPVVVMVPGLQTVQVVTEPDDVYRRWLVGVMLVLMVPAYSLTVVQWRRVRAVAWAEGTRSPA